MLPRVFLLATLPLTAIALPSLDETAGLVGSRKELERKSDVTLALEEFSDRDTEKRNLVKRARAEIPFNCLNSDVGTTFTIGAITITLIKVGQYLKAQLNSGNAANVAFQFANGAVSYYFNPPAGKTQTQFYIDNRMGSQVTIEHN